MTKILSPTITLAKLYETQGQPIDALQIYKKLNLQKTSSKLEDKIDELKNIIFSKKIKYNKLIDKMFSLEEKKKFGEAFDAHIVDMESYWIAKMAAERQIPFIVIRSVSDTRQERLLPFMRMLTTDGRVQWKEAASYFVRRPQHLIALFHLVRNVRLAQRSIATSIDSLIAGL